MIKLICTQCQEEFDSPRKSRKYCSLDCSSKSKITKIKTKCGTCSNDLEVIISTLNNSKSGKVFCNKSCSNSHRNTLMVGEKHPNYKGNRYRKKAFDNLKKRCNNCGYKEHIEILEVHHKDCNRSNNKLDNLELLCPNCHSVKHFITKTGKWRKRK